MSFVPPFRPPNELEGKTRQEEMERKAARHIEVPGDDEGRRGSPGAIRRALRRVRAAIGRSS